ncbi:MAG TPA: hypothetical protein VEH50_08775 [Methylomirabilota bacterium]|nr:hypothetical protein [Methylomirabilota bacterium]
MWLDRLRRWLLAPGSWLALAYCGYWCALALDRAAVAVFLGPWAGSRVLAWRLTPFGVMIATTGYRTIPSAAFFSTLPLFLLLLLIAGMAVAGHRIRPLIARVALEFSALWAMLLILLEWTLVGRTPAPLIRRFIPPRFVWGVSPLLWIFLTIGLSLALGVAARPIAGPLIEAARATWKRTPLVIALLLVWLSMALVLAGAFHVSSAARFLGFHALEWLALPAGVCLLLILIGLAWKRPGEATISAPWPAGQSVTSVFAGVLLLIALLNSQALRRWYGERTMSRVDSAHYEVLSPPGAFTTEQISDFVAARETLLNDMAGRLHISAGKVRLRVIIYPDFPSMTAATGSRHANTVNGITVRAVLGGSIQQVDPAADAQALLHALWGVPSSERLDRWTARWLAGEWDGGDVSEAAAMLDRNTGHRSLVQLLNPQLDGVISPLIREPMGGAWIASIADQGGVETVRRLYRSKTSDPTAANLAASLGTTPQELERRWELWLYAYQAGMPTAATPSSAGSSMRMPMAMPMPMTMPMPMPRESEAPGIWPDFFFRGVSFTHEGWSGNGGGYASDEAAAQLHDIHDLGANAIALVAYAEARTGDNQIDYADSEETDEDLGQALWAAHALGMKVMLKPQLRVGRDRSAGEILFVDDDARAAWFRSYREFLLHYALLAERDHFDLFVIGTALGGVSSDVGAWRGLVADVRRVYHGPITYAAAWGAEFDSIRFWDALDYIGVDNYYPLLDASQDLSDAPPTASQLLPGADHLADEMGVVSARWHKPILFTEIGYPSLRGAASEPWSEDDSRGTSPEEQAAAYEATFRAFSGRAWFRGMFWWNWPSNGRAGDPTAGSYTPLGKPAEEILREWFVRVAANAPKTQESVP